MVDYVSVSASSALRLRSPALPVTWLCKMSMLIFSSVRKSSRTCTRTCAEGLMREAAWKPLRSLASWILFLPCDGVHLAGIVLVAGRQCRVSESEISVIKSCGLVRTWKKRRTWLALVPTWRCRPPAPRESAAQAVPPKYRRSEQQLLALAESGYLLSPRSSRVAERKLNNGELSGVQNPKRKQKVSPSILSSAFSAGKNCSAAASAWRPLFLAIQFVDGCLAAMSRIFSSCD